LHVRNRHAMKIFTCEQIREIDKETIANEPVASVDLMERASWQLYCWITSRFDRSRRILVFAGPGNNGGDGLALARMLAQNNYPTEVFYVQFTDTVSRDWKENRERLLQYPEVTFNIIESVDQFPRVDRDDLIIDAIFGSGLKRKADGIAAEVIREINKCDCITISVDMPSGLFGEDNGGNDPDSIVKADYCLSFEFPRLAFMFPENSIFTGEWFVLHIGLDAHAVMNMNSPYRFTQRPDVAPLLRIRKKFDHKGNYGHGLLIAGSAGKTGASILSAGAALRTGIGLLTCLVPNGNEIPIHSSLPEAMIIKDKSPDIITEISNTGAYSAVAAGPGLGTARETQNVLYRLFLESGKPLVIDADAINILAVNKDWFSHLHQEIILTPHLKEFERLAGKSVNGYARLKLQTAFSMQHKCIVILKGAHTSVAMPDGRVFFNSSGNPGMATAGSGDVLTGILLSLLAQGYHPEDAAVLGVYLHGLAGDIAAEESCMESIIASDIIKCIGKAFNRIREAVN